MSVTYTFIQYCLMEKEMCINGHGVRQNECINRKISRVLEALSLWQVIVTLGSFLPVQLKGFVFHSGGLK